MHKFLMEKKKAEFFFSAFYSNKNTEVLLQYHHFDTPPIFSFDREGSQLRELFQRSRLVLQSFLF